MGRCRRGAAEAVTAGVCKSRDLFDYPFCSSNRPNWASIHVGTNSSASLYVCIQTDIRADRQASMPVVGTERAYQQSGQKMTSLFNRAPLSHFSPPTSSAASAPPPARLEITP
ncbi:unnamed protein product [Protopolystoma xenopodis]|uniref:Uncharacterized protein n=1 Tax=Protopolystoma xenopodis TaxID=117903 RepID=A0A3S5AXU5_9PLAT|nr:unnamed protein product [Protopolystoma xenopodis]